MLHDNHVIWRKAYSLIPLLSHSFLSGKEKWNACPSKNKNAGLELLFRPTLPLSQCKQKYSAMCADIRNELKPSFESKKSKYDLSDIIDGTFHANYGWKNRFCATDMLYSCLAHLESPDKNKSDTDRFHDAMDCLTRSKTDLLENGIERAKLLLSAIYRQVHTLLDMNQVFAAGPFLYAVLLEGSPDAAYFSRPQSLTMLAQFLLSAFAATSRSKKANSLPLVLSSPYSSEDDTCLVVGIPPIGQESPKK
ncbi:hypothetical protein QYM36_002129 [Artemia franciscana]|uniref:Uncharacterized protein n=2 Tax=Artemia franciscana TaxID=6661 RepID=A0AA88I6J5_ARTSF|nr:hypothetical protein QYM36_002129 [Artemia franciscana]